MKLLFLDTETTGKDHGDRLCQLAYLMVKESTVQEDLEPAVAYFRPPVPISYEAMSVAHITNAMVADKESFEESATKKVLASLEDVCLVAHNAPFDISMLEKEGLVFPVYIDTLKVAQSVLDMPNYKLQYLRYALELDVRGTAHDAAGDVKVLLQLYIKLLGVICAENKCSWQEARDRMITISSNPVLLKKLQFGKYFGKSFEEVAVLDKKYLEWLYNETMKKLASEQDANMVYTLATYLGKK